MCFRGRSSMGSRSSMSHELAPKALSHRSSRAMSSLHSPCSRSTRTKAVQICRASPAAMPATRLLLSAASTPPHCHRAQATLHPCTHQRTVRRGARGEGTRMASIPHCHAALPHSNAPPTQRALAGPAPATLSPPPPLPQGQASDDTGQRCKRRMWWRGQQGSEG